jgi:hypothetical protein
MAIAFDSANGGVYNGGATTINWTVDTTTLTNGIIFVQASIRTGGTQDITSVTGNNGGESFTIINSALQSGNGDVCSLWYITNPTSAASYVITVNSSSNHVIKGQSSQYSGAAASQPDVVTSSAVTSGSGSSLASAATSVADNSWFVMSVSGDSGGPITAVTNCVKRATNGTDLAYAMLDSNAAKTPAGAFTMTINVGASTNAKTIMTPFAPTSAAVSAPKYFSNLLTLGVS